MLFHFLSWLQSSSCLAGCFWDISSSCLKACESLTACSPNSLSLLGFIYSYLHPFPTALKNATLSLPLIRKKNALTTLDSIWHLVPFCFWPAVLLALWPVGADVHTRSMFSVCRWRLKQQLCPHVNPLPPPSVTHKLNSQTLQIQSSQTWAQIIQFPQMPPRRPQRDPLVMQRSGSSGHKAVAEWGEWMNEAQSHGSIMTQSNWQIANPSCLKLTDLY